MKRKMTVVFKDENLYTQLKIEAIRRHTTASDIVSEALREWFESLEDAELLPIIKSAEKEWLEKGGRDWDDFEAELSSHDKTYPAPSLVKDEQS
jgi:hypothetical protein